MTIRFYLLISLFSVITSVATQTAIAQSEQTMKERWREMNRSKATALEEFQDLKFGLFIHWGLYAIPGGIWEGKKMEEMGSPSVAEWIQLVAKISRKQYAKLADEFNPSTFDANAIAKMAKDAGMKYIVITAKHHDGFALFKSKASPFNVVDASPFNRDIIAEFNQACRKFGLRFGVYYSHNIDWADGADAQYKETKTMNDREGKRTDAFGANLWDPSPNTFQSYLDNKSVPQVKELLYQFKDIRYIWFDMPGLMKPEQSFRFYKTVYDINPKIIISERIGNQMGDYAIPGDNKIPTEKDQYAIPWETVGTFNNSWGYKSYDQDWKSKEELLYWLLEIVSKGGNYMLNIGPRADGSVPEMVINNLQSIGKWLQVNQEAIYGTRPWRINHEGPAEYKITDTEQREKEGFTLQISPTDFWFTQKNGSVYAIALKTSSHSNILIKAFSKEIRTIQKVEILGFGKVAFAQKIDGLEVTLPLSIINLPNGYTLKVSFKREPE